MSRLSQVLHDLFGKDEKSLDAMAKVLTGISESGEYTLGEIMLCHVIIIYDYI